jgi:hypothetical protein
MGHFVADRIDVSLFVTFDKWLYLPPDRHALAYTAVWQNLIS